MTKQTAPPMSIRRSVEFEKLLRGALALTPSLSNRERGWFPKLMITVLNFYISQKGK
mgnify:CR=1 FL=1